MADPLPTDESATLVSRETDFDPQYGQNVTKDTYESFSGAMPPPSDSAIFDYVAVLNGGIYRTSFKYTDNGEGVYSYKLKAALSAEPLITCPIFGPTGAYPLGSVDPNDFSLISQAEQAPQMWKVYAAGFTTAPTTGFSLANNWPTTGATGVASAALVKYAQLILQGETEYYSPTVDLVITEDEEDIADTSDIRHIVTVTSAPDVEDGCTWMLFGIESDAVFSAGTSLWRNARTFRRSGPKGWNTDVYPTGGTYS